MINKITDRNCEDFDIIKSNINKQSGIEKNSIQFGYKSRFVTQEELIPDVPFLILRDDTIKQFVKEDRIIDAYTFIYLKCLFKPKIKYS